MAHRAASSLKAYRTAVWIARLRAVSIDRALTERLGRPIPVACNGALAVQTLRHAMRVAGCFAIRIGVALSIHIRLNIQRRWRLISFAAQDTDASYAAGKAQGIGRLGAGAVNVALFLTGEVDGRAWHKENECGSKVELHFCISIRWKVDDGRWTMVDLNGCFFVFLSFLAWLDVL